MTATPALLAVAAGVAVGHAVLPDHWVPLAVLGRTQRYSLARVTRLATFAGVAHVVTSLLLGGFIIAVGLQFRSVVEGAENLVVGSLLIATGVAFGAFEFAGRRGAGHQHGPHGHSHDHGHPHAHSDHDHSDHDHSDHDHQRGHGHGEAPAAARAGAAVVSSDHGVGRLRSAAAVLVPFGAAASPDLTILPVFLAATAVGVGASVATLVAFSLVTIVTIVALTVGASIGSRQLHLAWLDRWGNATTALVLIIVGVLVITGAI